VFSHGWPLNADAWDDQSFLGASNGFRAIAHDRRGHGRSSQPWNGNELDTYADDLAELIETLDLREAILVGHSTGGGEVTRYIGRHGTSRVAKAVLLAAIPPLMLKTDANPNGTPIEGTSRRPSGATGDTAFGYFADELIVPIPGRSAFAGDHLGKDTAVAYIQTVREHYRHGNIELELVDMLSSAERVALLVRERFHGDRPPVEIRRDNVYRMRGDRIVELSVFEADQYAVDQLVRDIRVDLQR
jgi:pimeloyl-ACP methyl ester carboxylesterase